MTTPLDHVLADRLRAGVAPEALAGRWGLRVPDILVRAQAAGWVPEQPELDLRPPGLRGGGR